jgi:fumarate hydratase class II
MMPVMAQALLESITILAGACRAFTQRCVSGIEANEDRCRALLAMNPSIATALNHRIGYDLAAEVAKEAVREGVSVRSVVLRRGLVPEDELDALLSVRGMTEGGGGGGE